jgi:ribonuclease-3
VSTLSLSKFAKKISLGNYILLSKGEILSGGKKKDTILAGAFEALVGAIYLDSGVTKAKEFIKNFIVPFYEKLKGKPFYVDNYKSALQEFYQKKNLPLPVYRIIEEIGPEHKKLFKVEVVWEGKSLARATGRSKKSAEQRAARKVLTKVIGKEIKDLVAETFFIERKINE